MSKNQNLVISFAILCIVCGTLFAFLTHDESLVQQQISERINLALRQTAHLLLKQSGDSTSTIAPIKQTAPNVYWVELGKAFKYDSLPVILQNSFDQHQIKDQYDVAVWDCDNQVLVLGYSLFDFLKKKDVACMGREQALRCLNFSVTFAEASILSSSSNYLWFILGGLFVLSLGTLVYFYTKKNKALPSTAVHNAENSGESTNIRIGKSIFDTRNQTIVIDGIEQKLTFQESKLLLFFCQHPNELLDRDFILKSVWNDEGVLVTRSVDVFVSRLRKILKQDDSLKITNVHSRGYRFEAKVF